MPTSTLSDFRLVNPVEPPTNNDDARIVDSQSQNQVTRRHASHMPNSKMLRKLERSLGEIKRTDQGVFQSIGTVVAVTDAMLEVRISEETFHAIRAVSCLVVPEEGDLVLLAGPGSESLYVLAVLERPGCRNARIATDGDLTFELRSGRFKVAATEGVDLISKNAVSVAADRIEARARAGNLLLGSVRLVAGVVDSTLERLSQSVKRVYRRIKELEHVRAGQLDYASEGNLRLHGENTLMTARELVKADAKQIHIG